MFRSRLLCAAAAISLASCAAPPDDTLRVVPRAGQKVSLRDRATGDRLQGSVLAISSDSLTVERGGESVRVSTELLRDGKVATATTSGVLKGVSIGMGLGAAAGLLVGAIAISNYECTGFLCGLEVLALPGYVLLGAAGGTVVGGVIGQTTRVPVWTRATMPGSVTALFGADLVTGDVVRLAGHTEVGTVVGGSGRVAMVRFESGAETPVDLAAMERYTGERSRTKGVRYGAAIGAGAAILSSIAQSAEAYTEPTPTEVLAATLLGATIGAVAGASIMKSSGHTWTAVGNPPAKSYSILPIVRWDRVGVAVRMLW